MAVSLKQREQIFDVVVVGGGSAGMLAAATAAKRHEHVLLIEKNAVLGKKLSISGGGRCNVTNNRPDTRDLASAYGEAGKFLHSLFARYGVRDTIVYFESHSVSLVEENEGRLFPSTHKASTIVSVLENDCRSSGVIVKCNSVVESIAKEDSIFVVTTAEGTVRAKSCIVATGGTARPDTGSTGEGFSWLRQLGHTIVPSSKALVPLTSSDIWLPDLAGVTLPAVKITIRLDGKRELQTQGKILFTHVGISGPSILNLSSQIGELLTAGAVTVGVGVFINDDEMSVRQQLQACLENHSNQKIQNALSNLVPTALVAPILILAGISPDTPAHSVRRDERARLGRYLYELPVTVSGLLGPDKAIATGGGVELSEIDWRTMESKIVPKLFLVGDVLNINRPSGGYSLQLCWSTGAVAGMSA